MTVSIKLKDVVGLMVDKFSEYEISQINSSGRGFNYAITKQGERKISINREKLAKILQNLKYHNYEQTAEQIISHLPELIESVA